MAHTKTIIIMGLVALLMIAQAFLIAWLYDKKQKKRASKKIDN